MLQHLNDSPEAPNRVVVIGAGGFVGGAVMAELNALGVDMHGVARSDVDLLSDSAAEVLAGYFKPGDAVVAVSAIAPAKDASMMIDNMKLAKAITDAVVARGDDISHVINISSDAVYTDTPTPLTEATCMAPGSYHGVMHLAREVMMQTEINVPFCSLRPTLVYGAADPHNGYGPNRFRRLVQGGENIVLFGEGEEKRDHVLVDDVARVIGLTLMHRSTGALNIATGHVASFRDIAEMTVMAVGTPVQISGSPRNGPMPHNGYRPFDITACQKAFNTFRYTPLAEGIAACL